MNKYEKLMLCIEKRLDDIKEDIRERDKVLCHLSSIQWDITKVWPKYLRKETEDKKEFYPTASSSLSLLNACEYVCAFICEAGREGNCSIEDSKHCIVENAIQKARKGRI